MATAPPSLPILVAGGGIGGLAAALALARHGFAVKVLEQASEIGEIGAGIQLGPNAFAAFDALGIGPKARSRLADSRTLESRRTNWAEVTGAGRSGCTMLPGSARTRCPAPMPCIFRSLRRIRLSACWPFCQRVLSEPSLHITLELHACAVGLTPKTVGRLFQRELGMTFREWRQLVQSSYAVTPKANEATSASSAWPWKRSSSTAASPARGTDTNTCRKPVLHPRRLLKRSQPSTCA
jgi:hypothetical protein